jgi:hypothetical protein
MGESSLAGANEALRRSNSLKCGSRDLASCNFLGYDASIASIRDLDPINNLDIMQSRCLFLS